MTTSHSGAGAKQIADLYTERARTAVPPIFGPAPVGQRIKTSLEYGLADPALFPTKELVEATEEVLAERPDVALNYGPPSRELYAQLAERLAAQGSPADADQLLLAYGSSQILALLPEVLVDKGDTVIIEGPSFLGAVRRFELAGARLVTIPVDDQGMDVDALEAALREMAAANVRPKFIYAIPTFHNPSGVTMPLERRKRLVALGAEYGVLIVEDDAYGDLRFTGEDLPTLAALDSEGWVLRVGTYSKILAPGVRVGWAFGQRELMQRLRMFKLEGENGPFQTHVVARYAANGRLEAHIAELSALYRHKCQVMLDTIAREFPADVRTLAPEGGFFVWSKLPADISATALLPLAAERGVSFLPGTRCFTNGAGDDAIRLAFSYHSAERIVEAVTHIGAAMHELRARGR